MSAEDLPKDEPKTYTEEELNAILDDKIKAVKAEIEEPLKKQVNEFRENNIKLMKAEEDRLAEIEKAKREAAEKNGDIETLKQFEEEQKQKLRDEYEAQIKSRDQIILGERQTSAVTDLASKFTDPELGKMMLKDMVEVGYSEDGNPQTKFKNIKGETIIVNDVNEFFNNYLSTVPSIQPLLRGIQFEGGGANPKNNGGYSGAVPKSLKDCYNPDGSIDKSKEKAFYASQLKR